MDTNTVQLIEKFGIKLDGYVEVLASKTGMATEHFWPVFVRQQQIEGFTYIGVPLLAFVVLFFITVRLYKNPKTRDSGDFIPTTIVSIIVFIGLLITTAGNLPKIFNPEYAAVQEVVKMIK